MIEPTHIAEHLISEIYSRSVEVRALFAKQLGEGVLPSTAVPNIQLSACAGLLFDGAHKIDIAILDGQRTCIPCEAKLGNDRLGKKQFEDRFLKKCTTSHKDKRIAGSMVSILERNLPDICSNTPLTVSHNGRDYEVALTWFLIVRKRILDSWERAGLPSFSSRCIPISFEAIVEAFGGKTPFNSLICDMLRFDYYETWRV